MNSPKIILQIWATDYPGWGQPGPVHIEESVFEGDTLRLVLNRLAERDPRIRRVFNPETQGIAEDMALVVNDRVPSTSPDLEIGLKEGDRILLFPYMAGG